MEWNLIIFYIINERSQNIDMSTKNKILSTALKMISQNGYSGTSIRKIASEVGVRESAIYNHFSSKEEILKSIFENHSKSIAASELITEDLIELLGTPKIFLEKLSGKVMDLWRSEEEQMLWKILLKEEISVNIDSNYSLKAYIQNLLALFELLFLQMSEHGFIKKLSPKTLAYQFLSPLLLLRMTILHSNDKNEIAEADKEVKQHINTFWEFVKNEH